VYRLSRTDAVSVDRVLGRGGTKLLRETLAHLAEVRATLGQHAEELLDWKPIGHNCYETIVNGVPVTLRLDGSLAEITTSNLVSVYDGQDPTEQQVVLQTAINRKVNRLLAVAMSRRVTQQLQEAVQARVQQYVEERQTVSDAYVLRVNAYYP
jgi:ATP-dependent Lon protease